MLLPVEPQAACITRRCEWCVLGTRLPAKAGDRRRSGDAGRGLLAGCRRARQCSARSSCVRSVAWSSLHKHNLMAKRLRRCWHSCPPAPRTHVHSHPRTTPLDTHCTALCAPSLSRAEITRRIGEGSFGEVLLASFRGTKVAVKRLRGFDVPEQEPGAGGADETAGMHPGERGPSPTQMPIFRQFFEVGGWGWGGGAGRGRAASWAVGCTLVSLVVHLLPPRVSGSAMCWVQQWQSLWKPANVGGGASRVAVTSGSCAWPNSLARGCLCPAQELSVFALSPSHFD